MTLSAIPDVEPRDGDHLPELEPVHDGRPRLELEQRREASHRALQRAVREPGTCRMPARAVKGELGNDIPEAARVNREIRRLEDDRESRIVNERRTVEQRGERVVLRRQLLATEEQERDVARGRRRDRGRARAPPQLRARPSCRSHRGREPFRRRSGREDCPAQARCRSAPPARSADVRASARRANRNASSPANSAAKPGGTSSRRCSRMAVSLPLCEGMSTSSSVRAARRSASAVTAGAYRGIIPR